jgi:hypothetical protein
MCSIGPGVPESGTVAALDGDLVTFRIAQEAEAYLLREELRYSYKMFEVDVSY